MPLVKQVILFIIDGLRPDALQQAHTPEIDRLINQGAYSWQAHTITPSITLPCHASLFTAVSPSSHGINDNVWTPSSPPATSLIDVMHQSGLSMAAFYSWEPLRDLFSLGALNFTYYRKLEDSIDREVSEIGTAAAAYLREQLPAFTYVYLEVTDKIGHIHGWMSEQYLQAVSLADRDIGLVLESLRASGNLKDTVCIVQADHGGHDHDHSFGFAEDINIPWIISGPGIRCGYSITRSLSIMDTAPTIAHLLELPVPIEWSGQVITEVLMS